MKGLMVSCTRAHHPGRVGGVPLQPIRIQRHIAITAGIDDHILETEKYSTK